MKSVASSSLLQDSLAFLVQGGNVDEVVAHSLYAAGSKEEEVSSIRTGDLEASMQEGVEVGTSLWCLMLLHQHAPLSTSRAKILIEIKDRE